MLQSSLNSIYSHLLMFGLEWYPSNSSKTSMCWPLWTMQRNPSNVTERREKRSMSYNQPYLMQSLLSWFHTWDYWPDNWALHMNHWNMTITTNLPTILALIKPKVCPTATAAYKQFRSLVSNNKEDEWLWTANQNFTCEWILWLTNSGED